ncbi:MAG: polysaccharide ABC transporter ATP-binding protein [Saprospiraceae bacterium]
MSTVIKVENVSKQYRLGKVGTGTISHDLNRWWHNLRGKEDPYLKIGETNDRTQKGSTDYVWALQDINFEIEQGSAVGIIGRNGAGKSTLLKILSRTTAPTTGDVKLKGRVASLLEVGTGFHPELSGRENIYLNGAILGMTRREITRKFDEIVDFAGVERYVDTPVKRYSSGMYVRLAFAVAAHLESEILIVDEVLAVGDAEFQKKCLGKMSDVSKGEGRTVLFVSHNLGAVKQLCNSGIVLKNGNITFEGDAENAINQYLSQNKVEGLSSKYEKTVLENKDIELIFAEIRDKNTNNRSEFDIMENIYIELILNCNKIITNLYGYIAIKNNQEELFIESDTYDIPPNPLENLHLGNNRFLVKINSNTLPIGEYNFYISFASTHSDSFLVDVPKEILSFNVFDNTTKRGMRRTAKSSSLLQWTPIYVE